MVQPDVSPTAPGWLALLVVIASAPELFALFEQIWPVFHAWRLASDLIFVTNNT